MQTATKKANQILLCFILNFKVKMVKVYLFLRCKLAFPFMKDRDVMLTIPKYRRFSPQIPDYR